MKKAYISPVMEIENFAPNEYVAVCTTVTLPGGTTVEAFDVEANKYYNNYPWLEDQYINGNWPKPDKDVILPVFRGSFKAKMPDGTIREFVTADGNVGTPGFPNSDNCINGDQGTMFDSEHYHYIGSTTNHS